MLSFYCIFFIILLCFNDVLIRASKNTIYFTETGGSMIGEFIWENNIKYGYSFSVLKESVLNQYKTFDALNINIIEYNATSNGYCSDPARATYQIFKYNDNTGWNNIYTISTTLSYRFSKKYAHLYTSMGDRTQLTPGLWLILVTLKPFAASIMCECMFLRDILLCILLLSLLLLILYLYDEYRHMHGKTMV